MAAPAKQDLTIVRGDTEIVDVTLTTDGSTPINITGRTYASQMRTTPDIAAIAITGTCTIVNGAAGEMRVTFSAADTADLDPGYLYWDLQETAGSTVSTILAGTVTVLADVTRL
jgi:hypothetical protein